MIGFDEAAEVLEEFDEIGMEVAGETVGIYVTGSTTHTALVLEHCLWESEEGSDWTNKNDREVATTKDELREALIGELEDRVSFLREVAVKAARKSAARQIDETIVRSKAARAKP